MKYANTESIRSSEEKDGNSGTKKIKYCPNALFSVAVPMALTQDYGCHLRLHRPILKSPFYANHSRNLYADSLLLKFPSITFCYFESNFFNVEDFLTSMTVQYIH